MSLMFLPLQSNLSSNYPALNELHTTVNIINGAHLTNSKTAWLNYYIIVVEPKFYLNYITLKEKR